MSKYLLVFLTALLVFFGIYSYTTDIGVSAAAQNTQYSNYLTTASYDAAKEMKKQATSSILMPTEADRKRVADTFFRSLSMDFGYTTEDDMNRLHVYVPVLTLIDTDGYYICYNATADNGDVKKVASVITPINTWTLTTQNYIIRYYLGDKVDVTLLASHGSSPEEAAGKTYTGTHKDVLKKLQEYGLPTQDLLDDPDDATNNEDGPFSDAHNGGPTDLTYYDYYKRNAIIDQVREKIEYYINTNNQYASEYTPGYTFEMPMTTRDEWQRMLQNPSCIAFLQGIRVADATNYINIYAFSAGEVKKSGWIGYTIGDDGKKTYYDGKNAPADLDGYYANQKIAAASDGDFELSEYDGSSGPGGNGVVYVHHHWGTPDNEGFADKMGCYTRPILHHHTEQCYFRQLQHLHYDINGEFRDDEEVDGTLGGAPGTIVTALDGTQHELCYTVPVYHVHTDECWQDVYHKHTGNAIDGGGCYTIPVYHVHTPECYSKEAGEERLLTVPVYHTHKYPTYHYAVYDEKTRKVTYDVPADTKDAFIYRADVEGTCYEGGANYVKRTYEWHGIKTTKIYTVVKEEFVRDSNRYKQFEAPAEGEYTFTLRTTGKGYSVTVPLQKNEMIYISIAPEPSNDVAAADLWTASNSVFITKANPSVSRLEEMWDQVILFVGGKDAEEVLAPVKEAGKYNRDTQDYINNNFVINSVYVSGTGNAGSDLTIESDIVTDYYEQSVNEKDCYQYTDGAMKTWVDGVSEITATATLVHTEASKEWSPGYYLDSLVMTCEKDESSVETDADGNPITTPYIDPEGNTVTIKATAAGQLICGKTTAFVEYYRIGCGYLSGEADNNVAGDRMAIVNGHITAEQTAYFNEHEAVYSLSDWEMVNSWGISPIEKLYISGELDDDPMNPTPGMTKEEFLTAKSNYYTQEVWDARSITGRSRICEKFSVEDEAADLTGVTKATVEKYKLGCGHEYGELLEDFSEERETSAICGHEEGDIVGYELGCGLEEGQTITREQAMQYNAPADRPIDW